METVQRVRHGRSYRLAQVVSAVSLTPRMRRVVVQSQELSDFRTDAFDDHVRLFFPAPGAAVPMATPGPNGLIFPEGAARPVGRDYTPREFDSGQNRLTIDFVLHGDGPGSRWGERALPGDSVGIAGPVRSMIVPSNFDWHLLIGDETALPAIGRRVEELPVGARAIAYLEIANGAERQTFNTAANVDINWLERDTAPPDRVPTLLADAVAAATLPDGRGVAFVACENTAARAIRRHLVEDRALEAGLVRAYRFWQRGAPDLGQGG